VSLLDGVQFVDVFLVVFIQFKINKFAIKQGHGTAKTIEQLYDEITKHAFLNYDVESEKLLASKKDFENNNGTIRSYKSQILIYKCQMKELQDKKTNKNTLMC
jgi:major membrane immunogen (membrane-anchored lipoprotein)